MNNRPLGNWQPMNTAPLDGTHVLLLIEGMAIEGWWDDFWPRWAVVSLSSHGCGCCSGPNAEPDGWLPLPVITPAAGASAGG